MKWDESDFKFKKSCCNYLEYIYKIVENYIVENNIDNEELEKVFDYIETLERKIARYEGGHYYENN